MLKSTLLPALLFLSLNIFAQTNKEEAEKLCLEAIEKMDNGAVDESLDLLKKAKKLDPESILVDYETAFAYMRKENFKKAISVAEKMTQHEDCFPDVYQMLGNCHDYNGQPKKAIESYKAGLERFPNSGKLHLEMGNMLMVEKKYNEALSWYENGIVKEPSFPSNYYWTSKLYLSTENEYLGLIYGEIFMNLERNSARTAEISELLYKVYESEITFPEKDKASISFASNQISISDPENFDLPYGLMVYEPTMILSIIGVEEINMTTLNFIRKNFVNQYYSMKHHKEHPNVLFEYQKTLVDKGFMDAYNRWILMKGDEEAFGKWVEENKDAWQQFVDWFIANPLEVTEENKFTTP